MRQALIEGANTKKEARKEGRRSEINYKGNKSLQEEELRLTVTVPRERGRTEAAEIFLYHTSSWLVLLVWRKRANNSFQDVEVNVRTRGCEPPGKHTHRKHTRDETETKKSNAKSGFCFSWRRRRGNRKFALGKKLFFSLSCAVTCNTFAASVTFSRISRKKHWADN